MGLRKPYPVSGASCLPVPLTPDEMVIAVFSTGLCLSQPVIEGVVHGFKNRFE